VESWGPVNEDLESNWEPGFVAVPRPDRGERRWWTWLAQLPEQVEALLEGELDGDEN
jgi:hypothetical protein